ncbi:diguanylate cyclase [Cronobacter dublinensis]|uniref:diguanylate cyclase n=1 Tax=Cronobacter dublinensis TaxID=413497 RepID=UPI001375797B|nr:diguanylate cyclase [Cronobacter dublinensis]EKY3088795.1 diguanylate cyclase [Cronobacter dublinensis]ELQ6228703.1 diguanylate cyclase [Cronobacter dublinensis]ELY4004546.1 diguanylate cyclase [Cronobacter dublinensis]ELY4406754.1 diguanylate cyclase [Cronobacter dublinensis]ELY5819990.1 diguanylate cyclase [Cronobacter dublinensis]
MRIATITNFAYGATVALTLASGVVLMMASSADKEERAAVRQSAVFDRLTETVEQETYALTELARVYVVERRAEDLAAWQAKKAQDDKDEAHLARLRDVGATPEELDHLREGMALAHELEDEQQQAVEAVARGENERAMQLLFGVGYERELDKMDFQFAHFRSLLDQRTSAAIQQATDASMRLRTLSEIMVGLTALLFLFVLGFILKRRILRPVVKLSDVVNRLATQDYDVEAPLLQQVDEIGDMAQAIHIFRENGLARQRLEQERDADWAIRRLLSRMTQRLQGSESRHDIIELTRLFAPQIAPGLAGRLYVLDTRDNLMTCVARWLDVSGGDAAFTPDECWALRRGQMHSPGRDLVDIPCKHLSAVAATKAICVPLIAQNETIGLLSFEKINEDREPPYVYLELMAETLALALANQKLRDELIEKAMYDPLTGMRNRYHLEEALHACISQAEASGAPVSCLMIDIDYFKTLNDQYGHDAGDAALKEIARAMRATLSDTAQAFRYGGEEFLVLLPGMAEAQAHALATRLLHQVSGLSLRYNGQEIGPVSVSIGLATWPDHARRENLVKNADIALYLAKEMGRSRIVVANRLKPTA